MRARQRELLDTLARVLPVRARLASDGDASVPPALTRKRRGPLSIARLTADTGYRPAYTLEAGLRQYVEWVRTEEQG